MHIFISYSREDRGAMEQLRVQLATAGLEVWTDEGIQVGTPNWQLAIETAIEQAIAVVCILTPAAKRSVWVREELAYATFQETPIFMLHAAGDYREVAILGFTVAQLIDLRAEPLREARMAQLTHRLRTMWQERTGVDATRLERGGSGLTRPPLALEPPRSQIEEIVRHFLPSVVPKGERHSLLVVQGAEIAGRPVFRLDQLVVTIGRDAASGLRLIDDSVSREHAQLIFTHDGYILRDLESSNGTFVNDLRTRLATLQPGDRIRIGHHCVFSYVRSRVG